MQTANAVKTWEARALLKAAIRDFFNRRHYLELDTPIAVPCPGTELHLNYFKTEWVDYQGRAHPLWLRSSPELHMKQALAEGANRIFQMAPCFRNGGERSAWHHPEFTMLEWYEVGISFDDYIDQTVDLLRATHAYVSKALGSPLPLQLPKTFPRLTVREAFAEFAGIDLHDEDAELAKQARSQGVISVNAHDDFDTAYFKVLLEKIEPALTKLQAVVLCDYPPSQAALAKVVDGVAKRFEVYMGGIELCNGFYELIDAKENIRRIRETNAQRRKLGKEVTQEDNGFYWALERGIPDCCGNALGFDRWLALLLGHSNLEQVIPFEHCWLDKQALFKL